MSFSRREADGFKFKPRLVTTGAIKSGSAALVRLKGGSAGSKREAKRKKHYAKRKTPPLALTHYCGTRQFPMGRACFEPRTTGRLVLVSLGAIYKPIFFFKSPKKLTRIPTLEREERGVSRPMALEEEKSSLQVSWRIQT